MKAQLNSIASQSFQNWFLKVSDDASSDETIKILNNYKCQWGDQRISIKMGPGKGFASNFFSLIYDQSFQADYYAFSDQDDVWEKNKLEKGLNWLKKISPEIPALYCSRTRLIDEREKQNWIFPIVRKRTLF